jgi:UDP-N-acetylmuramate dehydrogenase
MFILENVPLNAYSTMRLGGPARYLTDITNQFEIPKAIAWADERNLPIVMIGGGSNIYWDDAGFAGLVMVNKIEHFETIDAGNDEAYFTVGAGENWDSVVERTVSAGYSGLAELSLIPGSAGATPIQNVGAYGQEVSNVLTTVQAYDAEEKKFVTIRGSECEFGYRTSRFKTTDKGRFFIIAVTFRLNKLPPQPPFYKALQHYFEEKGISEYSAQSVRDAVVTIRNAKLPDPKFIASNGSFYANPIVTKETFLEIFSKNPNLASWHSKWFWELPDGTYKLAVGALLEAIGLKGYQDAESGMATWPQQAMVLINEHASSTAQLEAFKHRIEDAVLQQYGLTLEQEPEKITPA